VGEALTAIDMATLLDPGEPEVRAAANRAREILAGLGARPFLNRLEAAMARSPEGPGHPAALASSASVAPA
jgi:hypothetical protein